MRRADVRVGMDVVHDTTRRYLGKVVSVNGIVVRLDRGEKPLATTYEIQMAKPEEVES